MIILAIDPGSAESSYAFCRFTDGAKPLISQDVSGRQIPPIMFGTCKNDELFGKVAEMGAVPDIAVIERIACYGMAIGETTLDTVFWTGRFYEQLSSLFFFDENRIDRITRKEVVVHLCGSARANDSNVIQELKNRFGEKGKKKSPGLLYGIKKDEWQALAVAVAYAEGVRCGKDLAKVCK